MVVAREDQLFREAAARIALWKRDYCLGVKELLGLEPTPHQSQLFRAMQDPMARVSVVSGHGTGKTAALAGLIILYLSIFDDIKILCTAGTSQQLESVLIPECQKWAGKMNTWFREQLEFKAHKIQQKGSGNCFAVFRTARKENPEALQGTHEDNVLVVVDEASGVHDSIFQVAEGGMTGADKFGFAQWILTGNPTRTTGYFYDTFHANSGDWVNLRFNSEDSPRVSDKWVEARKNEYGEDSDLYKIRVLGQFPERGIAELISREVVEEASNRSYHPSAFKAYPKIMGIDIAQMGDDKTCVALRQGFGAKIVARMSKIETEQLIRVLNQNIIRYSPDAIFVDRGAGGNIIVDLLKRAGHSPIAVNFGGKPTKDSDIYANQRAYMWCQMRDWLEDGGAIPLDSLDLQKQLCAPEYGFGGNGSKILLEKKHDMKGRLNFSPDEADALALTFAMDVKKKDDTPFPNVTRRGYDPLDLFFDEEING